MLIQITNTCTMGCPHCMQDSVPAPFHMSMEDAERAHGFAMKSGSTVILLSGGEPTEHPHFREIAGMFLDFPWVVIVSNGLWIEDEDKTRMVTELLSRRNVYLQVTSIPGIYPRQADIKKLEGLPRTFVHTGEIHMKALGRAASSERFSRMAAEDRYAMSCLSSASTAAQLPYKDAVRSMELRGIVCHPMVDFRGNLHWSESWLCPSFGNIREEFEELERKASEWRPCCKCADYRKLLARRESNYMKIREILNI